MYKNIFKTPTIILFIILNVACSSNYQLVDTPTIYSGEAGYPAEILDKSLQTVNPTIFYITDRKPVNNENGEITYGTSRSSSMGFGKAEVTFGKEISWEDLTQSSALSPREKNVELKVSKIQELVRFPLTPFQVYKKGDDFFTLPSIEKDNATAHLLTQDSLIQVNKKTASKDVILFVHGFNNDFNDAIISLANIWHFTGRNSVPIIFSWPASSGGLFGYFKDRESGEFSVYHLKETLRLLSSMDEIENIHVIAHSRGTDIATTAIRELIIEWKASPQRARDVLKIKNLILAAPDLDFGVVKQRLIAERIGPEIGQITVYMNKNDGALGFAEYLMSGLRFGRLDDEHLEENEQKIFSKIKNVSFISVDNVGGFLGHSYFYENPRVLSDISILINKGSKPGDKDRPLDQDKFNFWHIPKDYLNPSKN